MRKTFILTIAVSCMFLSAGLALSQQEKVSETKAPEEAEVQWLWGEVVSSDIPNKALTVQYLDYDTDIEKQITITADEKTAFENVKSLDEIKPQDTVSIDYVLTADKRNIAKIISVERMDDIADAEEPMPEEMEKVGSGPLSSESGIIPSDEGTIAITDDSKADR